MDCTVKSPALQQLLQACPVPGLATCLSSVERDFGEYAGDFSALVEKYEVFVKPSLQAAEKLQALVRAAVELASAEAPHWDKIAARLRYLVFARQLSEDEARRGITNFVAKLRYLTAKGLYGSYILEHYTERELSAAITSTRTQASTSCSRATSSTRITAWRSSRRRRCTSASPCTSRCSSRLLCAWTGSAASTTC